MRSLLEAAGLPTTRSSHSSLRTTSRSSRLEAHSAGRKAVFARAEDLIAGISAMQQERRAAKRKIDPEWEQIRDWLVRNFGPARADRKAARSRRHEMT